MSVRVLHKVVSGTFCFLESSSSQPHHSKGGIRAHLHTVPLKQFSYMRMDDLSSLAPYQHKKGEG